MTASSRRTLSPEDTSRMGVAGAWLPPLSARNPSSSLLMRSDSKEVNVSGELQPRIEFATFSSTKIGRKGIARPPITPNVASKGISSSLLSP